MAYIKMWGEKEKKKARVKIRDNEVIKKIYNIFFIEGFSFWRYATHDPYLPMDIRAKAFLKEYIKR